ncbi:hypothetical protein IQ276_037835 [Desmonostoc muscorum LEGE 12446]|uniref:Uncharacterized protein n=1 Tax=Desmonostoc muscorum LEGE 12446 TaxID=1828758 RepID=A0A8J6ZVD6_DESMC|nr:hypothetical protein [Desmonostoc muscorum]MCF2152063.1 hypothetical protein [Desmonostoc muscorum LEGE 12446]
MKVPLRLSPALKNGHMRRLIVAQSNLRLPTGLTSAFSSSLEISFRKSAPIPRSGCQGHRTLI